MLDAKPCWGSEVEVLWHGGKMNVITSTRKSAFGCSGDGVIWNFGDDNRRSLSQNSGDNRVDDVASCDAVAAVANDRNARAEIGGCTGLREGGCSSGLRRSRRTSRTSDERARDHGRTEVWHRRSTRFSGGAINALLVLLRCGGKRRRSNGRGLVFVARGVQVERVVVDVRGGGSFGGWLLPVFKLSDSVSSGSAHGTLSLAVVVVVVNFERGESSSFGWELKIAHFVLVFV
jgi:hypothetical protein